jgi:hypothetical protein
LEEERDWKEPVTPEREEEERELKEPVRPERELNLAQLEERQEDLSLLEAILRESIRLNLREGG